jgi:hypothetical protein
MAQPNYGFAKRQRELAKKQKKEEKKRRKEAENAPAAGEGALEQTPAASGKDMPQP